MGRENGFHSKRRRWPSLSGDSPFREISDIIYGSIPLYYPINLIVDTPEFQRLRRIKQLGCASLVYPNADHSRFTHSLGVMHLARIFVSKLAERPELSITPSDRLCVSIAGLCHDLGHGPFSHVFDGPFLQYVKPNSTWTHEKGSILIFRRIRAYPWVREALSEYLDEKDFIFIEELIYPPKEKFNELGEWNLQGRGIEKAFLYDLISNVNDSLDVDKYDYLLRDSHHAGIAIHFNQNSLRRIMDWARPLEVVDSSSGHKYSRICYAYKVLDDLDAVGQSRYKLHDHLYNHRTARICEYMIVCALEAAAPYLKFLGDDGQMHKLGDVFGDIGAFLRVDDSIYQMIVNSAEPELRKARDYIACLEHRRLPKCVGRGELKIVIPLNEETVKDEILKRLGKGTLSNGDIIVCLRRLHRGMGLDKSPMSAVRLYNHKSSSQEMEAYAVDRLWLEKNPCPSGGAMSINVYVRREVYKRDESIATEVHKAFTSFVDENGSVMPTLGRDTDIRPKLDGMDKENNGFGILMKA